MDFKLIIVTTRTDLTDQIVDAAKSSGATGATILSARGTGIHEAKTFFGLSLEVQRDVVLFLLANQHVKPVLDAIRKAGEFHKPGTGIAFTLNVEDVVGLESQMPFFKK